MDTAAGDINPVGLPARPATALARPGSRAVVVGTGTHVTGSALPDIPAVAATVTAVRNALTDQCAMDGRNVVSVTDPEGPSQFLDAVNQAAAQAEDVLLLYYIGHGLVSLANELFLATTVTTDRDVMLPVEALPFAAVRGVLSASRGRYVVVVLDCCFSGRASGAFGTAVAEAFELTNVQGSYLLSATSATEQALAPPGERYTAFSGALLEFLRDGDPGAPRELTLDDANRHLTRTLPARGAPAPQRRLGGDAGTLVVAVNPRAPAVIRPRPDHPARMTAAPSGQRPCPYPGLDAFTAADAEYFFGRERLVDEILHVLASSSDNGPLAIVGRSGAGKSSLLRAGLLPAIKAGRLDVPGSRFWPQLVITPGEHPLRVLAQRLAAGTGRDEESVATTLAATPGELPRIAAAAPRDGRTTGGLVLCVDQFEEVFTACTEESERRAFIRALCAASVSGAPPTQVILGLRADFYGRCLDYPELAPMVMAGQVPVRPMSRDELRSAIEGPAATAGLRLEEGLPGRLLLDLESAEAPGRDADSALPLLAFALQTTWQQSDKQVLMLSDYEATGGIWGAVTQRAEAVYESLGQARDAAKLLLLSMVQLGDGTDDVRRRISMDDLLAGRPATKQAAIGKALDAYVGARLVTVDNDAAEIAHQALLRAWPRLRQWIEEDRAELLDHQRLTEAARFWKSSGGPLYTSARLEEARVWLDGKQARARRSLSPLEEEFVRASVRAARRGRNRRWSFVTAAVVAALLLVAGGVYAVQQRAGNQNSQAVESSVQLAQESDSLRARDPAGAMWLSLTAYNSYPTPQARTALYNSFTTPYPLALPGRGTGAVISVAYSPDGRTAAASWADGSVRLWNVSDPMHPELAATVNAGPGSELAFSPNGRLLAVHTSRSLELWKVTSGLSLLSATPMASLASQHGQERSPVAFSQDGRTVAIGNGDGSVRLLDDSDPRRLVPVASLPASGAPVNAVAFSPDGTTLAVAGGTQLRLWDVQHASKPAPRAVLTVSSALTVAFSPRGHLLVTGGSDGDVNAWNVAHPGHPVTVQTQNNSSGTGTFHSIAFRPDSDVFVTTNTSGTTEIWTPDSQSGKPTESDNGLPDPAGPDAIAFSPSGGQLITGDLSGAPQLWVMPAPLLPGTLDASTTMQAVSPLNWNGTLLVTDALADSSGNPTGPVKLWNVADPLRPALAGVLPGGWAYGGFLPDGHTLITEDLSERTIRLWNVDKPRHLQGGATFRTFNIQAASANGLLLLPDLVPGGGANVWDIRNIGHPVLDAAIKPVQLLSSEFPLGFFSTDLIGVADSNGLQLWDLANPRRPVQEGSVPDRNVFGATYESSAQLLTQPTTSPAAASADMALWRVVKLRKPSDWAVINVNPYSAAWVSAHTLAGDTADDKAIGLWNLRYPGKPTSTAVLPTGSGSAVGNRIVVSPDSRLLAAGVDTGANNLVADVLQVTGNDRNLAEYAQAPADGENYAFSRSDNFLATNLDQSGHDELNAFTAQPNDKVGILYPLDADSLYRQLCSIATQTPVNPSWWQYLPTTYYRPACS